MGRCARSELADDLVVALPDTRRDEVLARHLRAQGVNTFRDRNKTFSRMHGAAARTVRISWSACAPTTR
ncbi:MAG: hypothetical protein ACLT2T_07080 [Bilophila wadsworthia]